MHKIIAIIVFLLLAIPAWATCPNSPTGYAYCMDVAINSTYVSGSSDLTNFPLLVYISDANLKLVASSGHVVDGNDFHFETAGGTQLAHEVELYDGTNGIIWAWVLVPTVSYNSTTHVWMYYGKTGASGEEDAATLWANYAMVHHFEEAWSTSTDAYTDDSGNGNHGTLTDGNANSYRSTGQIGYAFYNSSDYINVDDAANLEPGSSAIIMSAWVNANTLSTENVIIAKGGYNTGHIQLGHGYGKWGFVANENSEAYETDSTQNTWFYLVGRFPGSGAAELYHNGVKKTDSSTWSTAITDDADNWKIGARETSLQWDGEIDELRVRIASDVSGDWITTEYNNQSAPGTFATAGSEDTPAAGGTTSPVFKVQGIIGTIFWRSVWLLDYWQ